jgi:hypothetical protein
MERSRCWSIYVVFLLGSDLKNIARLVESYGEVSSVGIGFQRWI